MFATFVWLEVKRYYSQPISAFFVLAFPAMLYLLFGSLSPWGDFPYGTEGANVSMYILAGMSLYGALTASTDVGASVALEREHGWHRQLALTSFTPRHYLFGKAVSAALISIGPVLTINTLGYFTSASAPASTWLTYSLLTLAGALLFSPLGMAVGFTVGAQAVNGILAALLVLCGFLGNIFAPLSGTVLKFAVYTPLYALQVICRWPITAGMVVGTDGEAARQDSLWVSAGSLAAWVAIIIIWAVAARRLRGTSR